MSGSTRRQITLPREENTSASIIQERLGLLEGKRYTGRIVLAGGASAALIEVSFVWGGGGVAAPHRHQ